MIGKVAAKHSRYSDGKKLTAETQQIGKVAAKHSKYNEPNDQEINLLSAWQNTAYTVRQNLHLLLSFNTKYQC